MEDTLITFETAKLAKDKGFDLYCEKQYYKCGKLSGFTGYDFMKKHHKNSAIHNITHKDYEGNNFENYESYCTAPTQSLLRKWIREVHNIDINIIYDAITYEVHLVHPHHDNGNELSYITRLPSGSLIDNTCKLTYESALEYALIESLKLIKL